MNELARISRIFWVLDHKYVLATEDVTASELTQEERNAVAELHHLESAGSALTCLHVRTGTRLRRWFTYARFSEVPDNTLPEFLSCGEDITIDLRVGDLLLYTSP